MWHSPPSPRNRQRNLYGPLGNLPDLHEGDVSFVATLVFSHGTRVTSPQKTIEGRYSAVPSYSLFLLPCAINGPTGFHASGTVLCHSWDKPHLTILSPWPSVFTRLGPGT